METCTIDSLPDEIVLIILGLARPWLEYIKFVNRRFYRLACMVRNLEMGRATRLHGIVSSWMITHALAHNGRDPLLLCKNMAFWISTGMMPAWAPDSAHVWCDSPTRAVAHPTIAGAFMPTFSEMARDKARQAKNHAAKNMILNVKEYIKCTVDIPGIGKIHFVRSRFRQGLVQQVTVSHCRSFDLAAVVCSYYIHSGGVEPYMTLSHTNSRQRLGIATYNPECAEENHAYHLKLLVPEKRAEIVNRAAMYLVRGIGVSLPDWMLAGFVAPEGSIYDPDRRGFTLMPPLSVITRRSDNSAVIPTPDSNCAVYL